MIISLMESLCRAVDISHVGGTRATTSRSEPRSKHSGTLLQAFWIMVKSIPITSACMVTRHAGRTLPSQYPLRVNLPTTLRTCPQLDATLMALTGCSHPRDDGGGGGSKWVAGVMLCGGRDEKFIWSHWSESN
jgi:hypothetical protein